MTVLLDGGSGMKSSFINGMDFLKIYNRYFLTSFPPLAAGAE